MIKTIALAGAAAALVIGSAAFAQTSTDPTNSPAVAPPASGDAPDTGTTAAPNSGATQPGPENVEPTPVAPAADQNGSNVSATTPTATDQSSMPSSNATDTSGAATADQNSSDAAATSSAGERG